MFRFIDMHLFHIKTKRNHSFCFSLLSVNSPGQNWHRRLQLNHSLSKSATVVQYNLTITNVHHMQSKFITSTSSCSTTKENRNPFTLCFWKLTSQLHFMPRGAYNRVHPFLFYFRSRLLRSNKGASIYIYIYISATTAWSPLCQRHTIGRTKHRTHTHVAYIHKHMQCIACRSR